MAAKRGGRLVIFTIASANYISYAATLMQSVRTHHPDAIRVIVLADRRQEFADIDLAAELWQCDQLGVAHLDEMKAYYSVIEFNTAIKPYAFTALFDHFKPDAAIYLDPDILLFNPLTEVTQALKRDSIVLTPHMMVPLQDGKEPSDHTILKSGVYNFGFFAARANKDARGLISWWQDRLRLHCQVDIKGNLFTDQRWMDLAPVLVEKPFILRHPGYNVAYWNMAHRKVARAKNGSLTVNGKPLVFFHFSGIVPDKPKVFSKHQNRFAVSELGEVGVLCDHYRALVLANRWRQYKGTPYAYDRFADGTRIEAPMRRWLLRAIDNKLLPDGVPPGLDAAFFDLPDEEFEGSATIVTRLMAQLWRERSDLQAAFNLTAEPGRAAYLNWFLDEAGSQGVSARAVAAAAEANGRAAKGRAKGARAAKRIAPPWPSLASLEGMDEAPPLADLLARDVSFPLGDQVIDLPAGMALAWESRADLQQAFPLASHRDVSAYIAWSMTDGMRQRAHAGRLTPGFIKSWTRISRMSALYGDVPLSEGMIATRDVGEGREGFAHSGRFPVDRLARLSHGLWFAYWAPRQYGWPEELVAGARRHFAASAKVEGAGIPLTRGEVALWELRQDLQRIFPLTDDHSVAEYLFWLVFHGMDEMGIALDDFDPKLVDFFLQTDPETPGVSRFLRFLCETRPDLRDRFDLATKKGRDGLLEWGGEHVMAQYGGSQFIRSVQARAAGAKPVPMSTPVAKPVRTGCVLTGYWSAPTGRGEDLRCTVHSLEAAGYRDYLIADLATRGFIGPDGEPVKVAGPVHARFNIVHTNADTVMADSAAMDAMGITAGRTIGYWAWELERLPSWWRHAFAAYDEIWASTRFAHDAFAAERLRPVTLVPLAVQMPDALPAPARAAYGWSEKETVFLFVFDLRSYIARKNPAAVVRAFLMAFPDPTTRVRLMIKTQGGAEKPAELEALREQCTDPRIEILDAELPRDDLIALIRGADCFVSLHRSEGFGRGPAEAMLLGKPVILTDYSGTADFADASCALPVSYDLVPVEPGAYPGADGQRWAEPLVESAAEKMRMVVEQPARVRALAAKARTRIQRLYAPKVVGRKIAAHLRLAPTQSQSQGQSQVKAPAARRPRAPAEPAMEEVA